MKKYRALPVVLLIVILSTTLGACASFASAVTSTELNLYAFSEYVPKELIAGFEKETGVKVNYETYATNEEMLAGLASNPAHADLIIPSDYAVEILVGQKSLLPLDLKAIPNYKNLDTSFLTPYFDPGGPKSGNPGDGNKFSLPYLWGTTGLVYDKTKVSVPLTSWEDLWRPELAGHIVVLDDSREMMGLALLTLGHGKSETNPAWLGEARDKLKKLAPGIVAFDAENPENYLLSGEAWVGVVYNGNATLAERTNPNLVYVLPVEGAGFWIDNMAIPADAPHADAALGFINYVLKPDNGALLVRDYPYSTPNTGALNYLKIHDAKLYDAYMGSLASNPSEDALLHTKLVTKVDATTADLYETYWADVKSAK